MKTMAVFKKKLSAAKAVRKSPNRRLFERYVTAWAALWQEDKERKEDLAQKAKKVMVLMKRFRTLSVDTQFGMVMWIVGMKKEASLKDLVGYFGKAKAEAFWKKLKMRRSEYLTVITREK